MGDLYRCPVDGTVLASLPPAGVVETICSACRRGYRVTRGKVTSTEIDRGRPQPHLCSVAVTLDADGERLVVKDVVPKARWTETPGESARATIVERSDRRGEAWRMLSLEFGARAPIELREARDTAAIRAVGAAARGTMATIFTVVLLVYFYHWAWVFLAIPGAALTALSAAWRWRETTTRRVVPTAMLDSLKREQWLLGRLLHYETEAAAVTRRIRRFEKQRDELLALAADIDEAGPGFETRADVMRRAVDVVDQHIANDSALRDAIARATTMVDIEYRAARVLDHLPDDTIDRITNTLTELDAMEEENRALEAQLEANAEVRLLTS